MDDFFIDENAIFDKMTIHNSPSGNYRLEVVPYKTKEGCWNCTLGNVYKNDVMIDRVRRNYHQFPFAWIENHKNGHDYLLCGEDYQGQTVIELDTGKRVNYLPKMAEVGAGFCWAGIKPSPDGTMVAVEGCYWACPYEVKIYDFSDPMEPPWLMLNTDRDNDEFFGWIDNESGEIGKSYEVSNIYNKKEHDLNDEELDEIDKREKEGEKGLWKVVSEKVIWHKLDIEALFVKFIGDNLKWRKDNKIPVSPDIVDMTNKFYKKLNDNQRNKIMSNKELVDILDWCYNNVIDVKELRRKK